MPSRPKRLGPRTQGRTKVGTCVWPRQMGYIAQKHPQEKWSDGSSPMWGLL